MGNYSTILKLSLVFFLAFLSQYTVAQSNPKKTLKEKITENNTLFQSNIDEAFIHIDNLLQESIRQNDSLSELILLDRKCKYYYIKNNPNGLITEGANLNLKALEYQAVYMQLMSNIYVAEAYSMNKLFDKALKTLENNIVIIDSVPEDNPKIFFAKANTLSSLANMYNDKGQPEKAVEQVKLVIENYKKLKNPNDIKKYQYLNFSNLAGLYYQFDLDSASHYAHKSISLADDTNIEDKIMITNYLVLGKVEKKNKRYQEALDYLLKADYIGNKIGAVLHNEEIYNNIIEVYTHLDKDEKTVIFKEKLNEYKLEVIQNKYKSLQKVVNNEKSIEEVVVTHESKNTVYLWIVIGLGGIIITTYNYYLKKQNGHKKTDFEPNDNSIIENTNDYETLLEMIEKDNPAFMFLFEQLYPDFSEKLLIIDSTLIKSEIEFCALLKLNLATKKIAQIKFLEVRTVQNKKYRIRKKLNIPQNKDTYNWFSEL